MNSMTSRPSQVKISAKRRISNSPDASMVIDSHLQLAQKLAQKKNYKAAIFELRQAIKAYPGNALCHSTLSVLYLQSQQNTMAGVHAKQALVLDPTNQLATKIQETLMKQKSDHAKRQQIKTEAKERGILGLLSKKVF
ncbi:hypothetical protein [Leptothoe sp. PORK10 BA2]|uniref:hypothetical protein n=1 Tax=Leptothoe sp. PORK10 BA2 TaxID=3110254 RepID=UPI002B1F553F|nr:hypothetical protein [Leptothoe sp. PORK10 BA2]MEA5467146.1 hypothetical protein [Leptothoe sp. PORK10 BA2]